MLKKLCSIAVIGGFALSLGACAQIESLEANLGSPQTTQAVANAKALGMAFVCEVAAGAQLTAQVLAQINAGKAIQGTDNKIYVASSIVCSAMGGVASAL